MCYGSLKVDKQSCVIETMKSRKATWVVMGCCVEEGRGDIGIPSWISFMILSEALGTILLLVLGFSCSASEGDKKGMVAGTTVAMLTAAAMIIPEMAEAASPGISPSVKNLLLSVVAGGVVLIAIGGAVAGVSTFDPVQRK
jgi:hypothetical protein